MKKIISVLAIAGLLLTFIVPATGQTTDETNMNTMKEDNDGVLVELKTTLGDVVVKLYNDTPLHRDNFLKLVSDGYYDGLLFHRVIDKFMVQAGDPDSRDAAPGKRLGAGNPDYTIEAEILYPKHYHKYGALAAARVGDAYNPQRRSSGSQFYIVTGKTYPTQQVEAMNRRMIMSEKQALFNKLVREHGQEVKAMKEASDTLGLRNLQAELAARVDAEIPELPLDKNIVDDYSTIGGTPNLDGQYTVFGEVVKGMDVVEKIQKAETDSNDRPKEDIKIISAKILK